MLLGIVVGLVGGRDVAFMSVIAQLVITLIKAFATPLLFVTIFDSMVDSQFKGSGVKRLFVIAAINSLAAMAIALFVIDVFNPGPWLAEIVGSAAHSGTTYQVKSATWSEVIKSLVPESVVQPFVTNQIPAVIILAILFGFAVRELPQITVVDKVRSVNAILLTILMRIFKLILYFIPLSVFAAVASAVGLQGISVFKGLSVYLIVCCGGMLLQIILVYQAWIAIYARRSLREFWGIAKTPVLYSFGINSSLATLPLTLKTLDELKVTPASARLSACVGTNFNNDGILLYQVAAVLMLAQALGVDMTFAQQVNLALLSLLATLGVAGIPEAGVIALTIVMTTAKLPIEVIPLLLSVDWVVARLRSVTNVLGDLTVAIAIDGPKTPKI